MGTTVAVASVALGAALIEKHVTLSRRDEGVDSAFSLEPAELKQLCETCREAWLSLGQAGYRLKTAEQPSSKFRRSIYAVDDIKAGEAFTPRNIRRIRPGLGLAPRYYDEILGKKASRDLERGTALDWDAVVKHDE